MQKKMYVAGLSGEEDEKAVVQAVSSVSGVTLCTANAQKAQVVVDYDTSVLGIDELISQAITQVGFEVLA